MASAAAAERLRMLWVQEAMAPELLRYDDDVVSAVLKALDEQKAANVPRLADDIGERALANVYQMEMDRVKYALTCYIRTRLLKIERHARYIKSTPEVQRRLATNELDYLHTYLAMVDRCLGQMFLERLSPQLGSLSEAEAGGVFMVDQPDVDQYVFVAVTHDVGAHRLDSGEDMDFQRGDVMAIRYRSVQALLHDGKIELL